ncbi:MAG TPA: hypothetical protein VGC41_21285 [Kofleriaceae bacterium]
MKILLWSATALCAVLGSLMYSTRGSSDAKHETPIAASAPVAHPRISSLGASPPVIAPAIAEAKPTDPGDFSIAQQRTRLEDRFASEKRDPAWANTAQQELHTDLGRFATREVAVRDIQCRASLCRIELALATHDAAPAFMEQWIYQRTWAGPGVADSDVVGADGQPSVVMFVGKEGQEL